MPRDRLPRTLKTTLLIGLLALVGACEQGTEEHGVIVLYHHVAEDTPASTSISPDQFRAHLEYLRDNNFNVIRLDAMISALQERRPLPDLSVAITFDDGYASIFDNAFPMLQEFGFPFALFVSTGPIDRAQPGYMNWDQVVELSEAGVLIGNHMVEHPHMIDREPAEDESVWLERNRRELLAAEQSIRERTGQSHRYLAYPYGEFDPALQTMLAEEGFVALAQNSGAAGFNSDFLALPRFPLASIYADLETASTKLRSLAFNLEKLQPRSPLTRDTSPSAILRFEPGDYRLSQIGCFANSQALKLEWSGQDVLTITADRDFSGRRWHYICTAPLPESDRFYWYSIQWINPGAD